MSTDAAVWREKLRSIGVISKRTGAKVAEGKDDGGHRWKATTDELGNVTTERAADRQDVTINAPHLNAQSTVREER
jgi:hypothetical protein